VDEVAKVENSSASRRQVRQLISDQNYRCALTRVELTPETAELDHVIPVAQGGSHSIENLQVLHKTVNRMKGTMSNDEFVEWCDLVSRASVHKPSPPPPPVVGSFREFT
jgi:5-methylcytosine-specific restriction endonuclease McrA